MCNSPDELFVFVGLPCGLAVVESETNSVVASWEEDGAEMAGLKSYNLAPSVYLITSVDDMGKHTQFVWGYWSIG